jgi:hypothetical protein
MSSKAYHQSDRDRRLASALLVGRNTFSGIVKRGLWNRVAKHARASRLSPYDRRNGGQDFGHPGTWFHLDRELPRRIARAIRNAMAGSPQFAYLQHAVVSGIHLERRRSCPSVPIHQDGTIAAVNQYKTDENLSGFVWLPLDYSSRPEPILSLTVPTGERGRGKGRVGARKRLASPQLAS